MKPVWNHAAERVNGSPLVALRIVRPAPNDAEVAFFQQTIVHISTFDRRAFLAAEWRLLRALMQSAREGVVCVR